MDFFRMARQAVFIIRAARWGPLSSPAWRQGSLGLAGDFLLPALPSLSEKDALCWDKRNKRAPLEIPASAHSSSTEVFSCHSGRHAFPPP